MHIIKLNTHIDPDGHLRLDIPTGFPAGDLEVVLVLPQSADKEKGPGKYDFTDLAGKLIWQGDPVAMQRKLRDEW